MNSSTKEGTWRAFYDRSKTKLFTLLRYALGSRQAAERAFVAVFVAYAKDSTDRGESPSVKAVLRKAIQWIRAERGVSDPPDSDSHRLLGLLPLEFRLAFLVTYSLQLEPEEAEEVLQESREEISLKAAAALRTVRQIQEVETVRR